MAKKSKERFLAVFRPSQHSLVITRTVLGPGEPEEVDYQTIATEIPDAHDVPAFIDEALLLVRLAGWTVSRKGNWTPRTVVRLHGEDTEWVWAVKPSHPQIHIEMSNHDFENMILSSTDNFVQHEPHRFTVAGPEAFDPELITLITTRGRAEGILAREYLRSTGWRVVEVWDTTQANPDNPWMDPGPTLLTDRPWRLRLSGK